ncbi:hypothetical protein CDD81_5211 [Ophiocordyceps australis]|uniref:Uncharacterized protein n=1 Tax=Ophiocordyceps australis TaxID=1399860 RepID=A0A2C5XV31_9HYPO|nr:hypothetical protein CDD81_5211 [Ophiocordyceps australis]
MKRLGSKAAVFIALTSLLAGAVPSIFECARNPCYNDLLYMSGSTAHLKSDCLSGKLSPGIKDIVIARAFLPSNPGCGHESRRKTRTYTSNDFRPVCDCLIPALVPRHCDSTRCYTELFEAADKSILTLREQCGTYQGKDVSIPMSSLQSQPTCGAQHGDTLVLNEDDYRDVCNCIRSSYDKAYPASDRVISGHMLSEHYIDVFLHIIVLSKSSLRAKRYKRKGELESEFRHLVQPLAETGIKFVVKSIDLTVDATWAMGKNNEAMRKALHKGDNRDLNFYMIDTLNGMDRDFAPLTRTLKTYCTPPSMSDVWKSERIGDPILDGCIVTTGVTQHTTSMALQRWIGTCKLETK